MKYGFFTSPIYGTGGVYFCVCLGGLQLRRTRIASWKGCREAVGGGLASLAEGSLGLAIWMAKLGPKYAGNPAHTQFVEFLAGNYSRMA